jgi:hypothetical protein
MILQFGRILLQSVNYWFPRSFQADQKKNLKTEKVQGEIWKGKEETKEVRKNTR